MADSTTTEIPGLKMAQALRGSLENGCGITVTDFDILIADMIGGQMASEPTVIRIPPSSPLAGLSVGQFLDRLPMFASIVGSGEKLRGASDDVLQAWCWGIEDTEANVRRLIKEWRAANDGA